MENMLEYIKETPEILSDIIDNSRKYTKPLIDFYIENCCKRIHLIASGSSYNGSLCALYFMKHILQSDIAVTAPFTFANHETPLNSDTMYIFISQSGCSTNILTAIKMLKEKGYKTACLVGRTDSDAEKLADLTINWHCGEEKIGFVTKGVSSLACFLMCFSLNLALKRKLIDDKTNIYYLDEMKKTQDLQPKLLENTIDIFAKNKEDFINAKKVILLSSGPNFGTITEGALKIAETCCRTAIACEAEEFLHGPLYPSTPEDLFIIIDNNNHPSTARLIDIAVAIKDVSEKVYVLGNTERFDTNHRFALEDQTDPLVSPLYKLTCLQTLAYMISENTNRYDPHEAVKRFKKANKVASKSRPDLYLDLQKIENSESAS